MKNRTYKKHNRAIKEISKGNWQCRIIPKRGDRPVEPFNTDTRKGAFNWLHGGSAPNVTQGYKNSTARRKERRASER